MVNPCLGVVSWGEFWGGGEPFITSGARRQKKDEGVGAGLAESVDGGLAQVAADGAVESFVRVAPLEKVLWGGGIVIIVLNTDIDIKMKPYESISKRMVPSSLSCE